MLSCSLQVPCLIVNFWLLYSCGFFSVAKIESLIFLCGIFKLANETHVFEDPSFCSFLQLSGSDFAHADGIHASAADQNTNSEEYTKNEQVISGSAISNFPSVILLAKFFFALHFHYSLL